MKAPVHARPDEPTTLRDAHGAVICTATTAAGAASLALLINTLDAIAVQSYSVPSATIIDAARTALAGWRS